MAIGVQHIYVPTKYYGPLNEKDSNMIFVVILKIIGTFKYKFINPQKTICIVFDHPLTMA